MSSASEYLAGARRYRVTGRVVVVRTAGTDKYLSQGAPLPADVPQAIVAHLLSAGLIEETAS